MKVVLFCGGLGTRLREYSDTIPKPLVTIGYQPVIWHLMRYYAHFGHKEFILCLGYRGDMIREYFLKHNDAMTNDFVLSQGGRHIEVTESDFDTWKITFVDTGLHSSIGQRLLLVKKYLVGEEVFLANYSDGISDLPLDKYIDDFHRRNVVASFASVRCPQTFHTVESTDDGLVTRISPLSEGATWVNGGYFILRREIFDYMNQGDELVNSPFERLIERRLLLTYRYHGFWRAMDTFKDKIALDRMAAIGECPWMVWRRSDVSRS